MNIEGSVRIGASVQDVWNALNDAEILKAAIPGCESLEQISESEFGATIVIKLGPIKTRFAGRVTLSDIVPLKSYTIAGAGEGGIAGFAKGAAKVTVSEQDPGTTLLSYVADAAVGGKIAQLGARLIVSTSNKLAAQFFNNLEQALASRAAA
jgi:carbon monoxide dehydrogenase subunit G